MHYTFHLCWTQQYYYNRYLKTSLAVLSFFILFRLGRVDGNSDNRANSAQVQLNLPIRAELGKMQSDVTGVMV